VTVGGWAPADPDPADGLARLRGELDAQVSRLARAGAATGSDRARVVTVTLDADGDVARVDVDPAWRRTLGPEGLGTAVVEAVREAALARLQAWATDAPDLASDPAPPAPVPDPAGSFAGELGTLVGRLDEAHGTRALRALVDVLERANRDLDDVTALVAGAPSRTVTTTGLSGGVTVETSGTGDPVAVRFDAEWIRSTDPATLGAETAQVLRQARRHAAETGPQARLADSAIGELAALSTDPVALARRFGLL